MDKNKIRPTRFAHSQGHTDVCYSDDGRYIITCGSDGDVRMFEGLDDDDSKSHNVSNEAYCIACKDKSLIVGTEMNMVQTFTFDEGQPDGIITRFTSIPTHIQISHDKNVIAIASSDMTIKVHDTINYKDTIFTGHAAPVLSVSIDPKGDFLASSSCDGTVRIWNYRTQSLVRSFSLIPTSNSFSFSKTLCRLSFTRDGRFLLIPVNLNILAYNREWKVDFKLQHSSIEEIISIVAISSCGLYVAGGCRDGRIIIWNIETKECILSEKPSNGIAVTGLVWNPSGKEEIVFSTGEGEIGTVENFFTVKDNSNIDQLSVAEHPTRKEENQNPLENDLVHTFNTEDFDEMADDDSEFSLAKIKAQMGFADDEEGTFIGTMNKNENDSIVSRAPSRLDTPLPEPVVVPKLPEPQRPFQPGMSPEHLIERYMVWNNTGIVRQYRSEEENSIEVEFHDSSIHHPLHLNNHIGYSMATLNSRALALAAESQEDQLSKLCIHHFSSWDGNKEWETEMPHGEDILAIGLGSDCVYAVTDKRNLRIFSIAGVQRDLLSIPGPIVCLAGWESLVMIVYHSGMGVGGEQNMSMIILDVNCKQHPFPFPSQIALSPNSFLAWAGFSDEGTPMIMDSAGMVKLMHSKMGQMWTCVLDTKQLTKGKSDHYFLIGASEIQGVVRCILCKGSRYPPILPRPHVMLLELKMPFCEMDSEKGTLEENMLMTKLLSGTVENLSRRGLDVEATQNYIERKLKENMLKLFALACRSDRELRALQICEIIPSHEMIDVAIKYATKIHRMHLAERLSEVVQKKIEENFSEQQEENNFLRRSHVSSINNEFYDDSASHFEENSLAELTGEISENEIKSNPLLTASSRRISKESSHHKTCISPALRNPFKKSQTMSSSSKGLELLDSFKNSIKEAPVLKPIVKKPKSKQTISRNQSISDKFKTQSLGKENNVIDINKSLPVTENNDSTSMLPTAKKPSALKLWLEDNKNIIIEKYPGASETELLVKAALLFKDVDTTVKERYKTLAAGCKVQTKMSDTPKINLNENEIEDKKRRPDPSSIAEPVEKKQKSGVSKLSAFAFSKKSS